MDNLDKVIWVLPVLAVLDVLSTFYTASLGFPLPYYERGLFADFFVDAGPLFIYTYVLVYLLGFTSAAYAIWAIKKKLRPEENLDKGVFLVLVGATCLIYARLTIAFLINFLLPSIIERGISVSSITLITGGSALLSLAYYLWSDVVTWIKVRKNKSQH